MKLPWLLPALLGVLVLTIANCSDDSDSGEHDRGAGEHSEGSGPDEGEESGTQFGLGDIYDEVRTGARLVISYDAPANVFTGSVENTISDTLREVRVEVHLSNGIELGPTSRVDLAPGQVVDISLAATEESFTTWSAHPEVGGGEHDGDGD